MADPRAIADAFTKFYYQKFDTNRADLLPLYRPQSMMTWEGIEFLSAEAIIQKLIELPFQRVEHQVTTFDVQPSSIGGAGPSMLLVSVTGQLLMDEEQNPLKFSQIFQLVDEGNGNWFVLNDMFRLNYG
ncbi:nuclear transport factor 2 [Flagelloscypha sp. PMI_526]|nr:nuclear transport factor 2 [Flagelloscypha sp. PMI_526]